MIKNKVEFSFKIGEMECQIFCSSDASLGFLYDCGNQFRSYLVKRISEEEGKNEGKEKAEDKSE